jgi:hypothetical protein
MVDDVAEGCLGVIFEVLIQGLLLGTGYGVLKLFGRGRDDGGFVELLAWVLGVGVWIGLGYFAYWLS